MAWGSVWFLCYWLEKICLAPSLDPRCRNFWYLVHLHCVDCICCLSLNLLDSSMKVGVQNRWIWDLQNKKIAQFWKKYLLIKTWTNFHNHGNEHFLLAFQVLYLHQNSEKIFTFCIVLYLFCIVMLYQYSMVSWQ